MNTHNILPDSDIRLGLTGTISVCVAGFIFRFCRRDLSSLDLQLIDRIFRLVAAHNVPEVKRLLAFASSSQKHRDACKGSVAIACKPKRRAGLRKMRVRNVRK